jgi:hypothetical protein
MGSYKNSRIGSSAKHSICYVPPDAAQEDLAAVIKCESVSCGLSFLGVVIFIPKWCPGAVGAQRRYISF